MNKMPVSLVLLSFLLVIPHCQTRSYISELDAAHFSHWFVNSTNAIEDTLSAFKIPLNTWDSLVNETKKATVASPGIFTTVLNDSTNTSYTVGWKTPSQIRHDTTYPLIIYLHGGIGSPLTTKGEKAYEMLLPLADTFSLFLASPSGNRFAPWWSAAGLYRIMQTLRYMTLHYPINPDKVFLAGVSDGATGCYAVANTMCGPFAGFIAVSGFGGMLPQMGIQLFPSNIMQRPIYNVNAGKDRIYPIEEVRKFLDWLTNSGVAIERKEYPDELHGFDYRGKEFGKLASLIRTWTKPSNNQGISWTFSPGISNCPDNIISWKLYKESPVSQVNAFWRNDTLQIKSQGIEDLVVSFPGLTSENIIVCINKQRTDKIHKLSPSSILSYEKMVHDGFPTASSDAMYRIKLPQ
jgi:pimeloyl-ACP methyl ester carboxylesterase